MCICQTNIWSSWSKRHYYGSAFDAVFSAFVLRDIFFVAGLTVLNLMSEHQQQQSLLEELIAKGSDQEESQRKKPAHSTGKGPEESECPGQDIDILRLELLEGVEIDGIKAIARKVPSVLVYYFSSANVHVDFICQGCDNWKRQVFEAYSGTPVRKKLSGARETTIQAI